MRKPADSRHYSPEDRFWSCLIPRLEAVHGNFMRVGRSYTKAVHESYILASITLIYEPSPRVDLDLKTHYHHPQLGKDRCV